ncbi:MAG: tetratricopeptide repeat protein [Thermodesulfobacteriota bacterium]|nr:tetratricopeptide repeat protein [Thermodesulfobacteriota bacterium]
MKNILYLSIIILVCLTCFSNTFSNEFVNWDDGMCYSPRYLDFKSIYNMFKLRGGGTYQPLREFAYAVDYSLWEKNPFGYHIQNLFWYILTCISIYFVFIILLDKTSFLKQNLYPHKNFYALSAALIFALHPLHVEAVVWLSGRKFVLLSFFYFLSFYFYCRFSSISKGSARIGYYLAALIAYYLALCSQPMAITFPLIILCYDLCFFKKFNGKELLHRIALYFPFWIPMLIIVHYFIFKAGTSLHSYPYGSFTKTAFVMNLIMVLYIVKLFFPFNLSSRYGFPPAESFFDAPYFLSLIANIIILTGIAMSVKKMREGRFILFFSLWYGINLLPTSNIVPISTQMADRYIYLSSFALSFFLILFVSKLVHNVRLQKTILFSILIFFGVLTFKQNEVWSNSISLWGHSSRTYPNEISFLNLGVAYYKKGLYDKSLEQYKNSIIYGTDNFKAYFNIGLIFDKLKNYKEALIYFNKANEIKPDSYEPYESIGLIFFKKGEYDTAIEYLKKGILLSPDVASLRNNYGSALQVKGLFDAAAGQFKTSIKLNPLLEDPYFNLSDIYLQRDNYKKAVNILKRLLKKNPESVEGYIKLGKAYIMWNKIDPAIDSYNKAKNLDPQNVQVKNNLGWAYIKSGKYKKAIHELNSALQQEPSNIKIRENLVNAYFNKGDMENTIVHAEIILEKNPESTYYRNILANAYYKEGFFAKAKGELLKIIAGNKALKENYNLLGSILFKENALIKAQENFLLALKLDPDFSDAHNNLGQIYFREKKLTEAEKNFRAALKKKPFSADIHNNLGSVLYHQKKFKPAEKEFLKAISCDSNYYLPYLNVGLLYYENIKDHKKAMLNLKKSLELKPDMKEKDEVYKILKNINKNHSMKKNLKNIK